METKRPPDCKAEIQSARPLGVWFATVSAKTKRGDAENAEAFAEEGTFVFKMVLPACEMSSVL